MDRYLGRRKGAGLLSSKLIYLPCWCVQAEAKTTALFEEENTEGEEDEELEVKKKE